MAAPGGAGPGGIMKTLFVSAIGFVAVLGLVLSARIGRAGTGPERPAAAPAASDAPPLACNRSALTESERKRHFDELGPALRKLKKSHRELSDGYEFEFPSDPATVRLVADWAAGEAACCPFFEIAMRLERKGGPLWLRLTGGPGVKHFIEVDGAAWLGK
jgi:hypothetical protein